MVVGAGVIGLSIGWRLAQQGISVAVVDRNVVKDRASHVAAGMLAPVTEADFGEDDLLRLNLASAAIYEDFLNELGVDHYQRGALFVGVDRDELAVVKRLFEFQVSLGLPVEWIDDAHELEPALSSSILGGALARGDSEVDPRVLTKALRKALTRCGGSLLLGHRVEQIVVEAGSATGAMLGNGTTLRSDLVVVAAGVWSSSFAGIPNVIRPVKGQILRLAGQKPIEHIVRTPEVYLVPHSNELVVGATVEEMGFDVEVTAGGVLGLLRAADEVVPGIREMHLVECSAGLRPATADNSPMLGRTAIDNLWVATGHYRNGILLAPITAEIMCELIVKGVASHDVKAFDPMRFN